MLILSIDANPQSLPYEVKLLLCYFVIFQFQRLESAAFSRICQSVIEKFNEVLSSSLWKQLSSDLLQNHYQLEEGDMKFSGFANRISGGLMVKIFVICIITVSDLFQKSMCTSLSQILHYCFSF